MATGIKYVDSSVAVDGDGSLATPFKFISSGLATLNRQVDQVLRIRGGRFYDVTSASGIASLGISNVIIEPYGESGNPCIDGLTYLPVGTVWTDEGGLTSGPGNLWSIQLGTAQTVRRVFAATTKSGVLLSQRVLGEALRRTPNSTSGASAAGLPASAVTTDTIASIKQTITENDPWYGAGATLTFKLYMWTPSALLDPSTYYQGLGIVQAGTGSGQGGTFGTSFGINLFNSQRVAVRNLKVRGASSWPLGVSVDDNTTLCEDITFYQCESDGSINGLRFSQYAKSTAYPTAIRRARAIECVFDSSSSAKETEPNQAYSLLSAANSSYINGRVDDVAFIDCVSINPTHASASIGAWDAAGAKPMRSGFLRHTARAEAWASYSRGLDMAMCESSCFVTNCLFIGMNVCSQLAGGTKVTGNRWKGMRAAIRKPSAGTTTDGWIALTGYRGNTRAANDPDVGTDQYYDMRPDGLVFANNSCDGCYGNPVEVTVFTSDSTEAIKPVPSYKDNSFFFFNNVLVDTAPGRAGKPYVFTLEEGTLTVGTQMFANNAVFAGAGNTPSARWRGTTYTDINTAPGHSANLIVDPVIDSDMRPRSGSPLLAAGRYIGYYQDAANKPFKLPSCIGAFEDYSILPRERRIIP